MTNRGQRDAAGWVRDGIRRYVDQSPDNHRQDPDRERAFDSPLVGFAAGDDPLFAAYKDHVGPFHWTPQEIFQHTFPEAPAAAADLTVIGWILPQTRAAKTDNRKAKEFPAERWSRARTFGEMFNARLRRHTVDRLGEAGIRAVAPMLSPRGKGGHPRSTAMPPPGRNAMRPMPADWGPSG